MLLVYLNRRLRRRIVSQSFMASSSSLRRDGGVYLRCLRHRLRFNPNSNPNLNPNPNPNPDPNPDPDPKELWPGEAGMKLEPPPGGILAILRHGRFYSVGEEQTVYLGAMGEGSDSKAMESWIENQRYSLPVEIPLLRVSLTLTLILTLTRMGGILYLISSTLPRKRQLRLGIY